MRLLFDCKTLKNGALVRMESEGTLIELTGAVGRLIQQLHEKFPEPVRPEFRAMIRAMVTDADTPIWEPTKAEVRIDLKELEKQVEEAYSDEP